MAIHILGNGPSISLFKRKAWPKSDLVIGCNFSKPEYHVDYTVLIDIRPIKFICSNGEHELNVPVVLSRKAYSKIKSNNAEDLFDIKDIVPIVKYPNIKETAAGSAGHTATVYAIENEREHNVIHIWGIDATWTNDLHSTTDEVVKRSKKVIENRPSIANGWRKYWGKIFKTYKDSHKFIIHAPEGVNIKMCEDTLHSLNFHVFYNADGHPIIQIDSIHHPIK